MQHLPLEVIPQITVVQAVLEHLLGNRLCGIHLFGSAVDRGLKPCSDIDLMVTVTSPLPAPLQQRLLQTLLAHSAWPGSNPSLRALEVTVVALSEIRQGGRCSLANGCALTYRPGVMNLPCQTTT